MTPMDGRPSGVATLTRRARDVTVGARRRYKVSAVETSRTTTRRLAAQQGRA